MPSLATLSFMDLHPFNMDTTDKKTGICKAGNLKSLLQPKVIKSTNTKGLCLEEIAQWSQSLERLLLSKCGRKIFQTFLKSEFSDENLEFWSVCEDYKKIKYSITMRARAKKIFNLYIEAEAPREINIDHKTRELISTNMKALSTVCFNDAQKIVYGLMERDSYPRFLKSDIYRTLLDSASGSMRT